MSSDAPSWTVGCSTHASNTRNPIRMLTDKMKPPTCNKTLLKLSIGDPTFDGNLKTPESHNDAVKKAIDSYQFNGYLPGVGYQKARDAVAKFWVDNFVSSEERAAEISGNNVIMTSGGSHAIQLAISGLCNPGDNLLIPSPGFPQYKAVCDSYGIEARFYTCDPDHDWEVVLGDLNKLTDEKTRGIVITNPSNPCGSNFTRNHVEAIVRKAEELKLAIFSDEIYAGMVFTGQTFTSVADIETSVPRVILGGTAKAFMVPGWRVGWLLFVDPKKIATQYYAGLEALSLIIVGPNSICQAAIPHVLNEVPAAYLTEVVGSIERGSKLTHDLLKGCHGITSTAPQGAMYVMAKVDPTMYADISSSMEFYEKLLDEEAVHILPGEIFNTPNYIRIVTTRPPEIISDALGRMAEFCGRHKKQ